MRIIAGQWRGRPLRAPEGISTRPTADRVRETLFSMLVSRLGSFDELRVADLFAGSGALGLEALSRGAAHCTFVETDRAALAALNANIATFGASATVRSHSAAALPAAPSPFNLILMDPPYCEGLADKALTALREKGWLAPSSWIAVETARGEALDTVGYAIDTVRPVGKAQISLLRVE